MGRDCLRSWCTFEADPLVTGDPGECQCFPASGIGGVYAQGVVHVMRIHWVLLRFTGIRPEEDTGKEG